MSEQVHEGLCIGLYFTVTQICSLGAIVLAIALTRYAATRNRLKQKTIELDVILRRKQSDRLNELSRLKSIYKLGPDQEKIIGKKYEDLLKSLQTRQLSATQVLTAFIAKALVVNEKINPITDFIPQAHEWAAKLDALEGVKGPLHGLPVCIKDDNSVEGMDATHGYAKQLNDPALESGVVVKLLLNLGAVPFCKTNVPQTLLTYGSDNPVFGVTGNAFNPKLSPGGSSSGTGALVGARGCLVGIGTDVGGSVRIPAHFNGVSGICPTPGRLSVKGCVSPLPNLIGLKGCVGLIGQTSTSVASVFQHLVNSNSVALSTSWDPFTLPIPWNESVFQSTEKLRIGYYTSIPFFPALGDTPEIVMKAKSALEDLGHTLVPFSGMPDGYKYMNTFAKFAMADQSRHFKKCWEGEHIAESVKLAWISSKLPIWFQKLVGFLLRSKIIPFFGSTRSGAMVGAGAVSSQELWDAAGVQKGITEQLIKDWQRLELDALLCPTMPFPAPPVNAPGMLPSAISYTGIWNLVAFPAGTVPFGNESGKNIDSYNDEGDMDLKFAKKCIKESVGAPIGVQVVGLPYKEELILRIMTELESKAVLKK